MNIHVRILQVDNGYILLDETAIAANGSHYGAKPRWVASTPEQLRELIYELAVTRPDPPADERLPRD